MHNEIDIGNHNTQQIGENPMNQSTPVQEKPKINYWVMSTVVLVVLLVSQNLFNLKQNLTKSSIFGSNKIILPDVNVSITQTIPPTKSILGCAVGKNYNYSINNSPTIENWCEIRVFYDWGDDKGYSLSFPNDWQTTLRGAAGMNLSLNKNSTQLVFVVVGHSDLAIEDYDKL